MLVPVPLTFVRNKNAAKAKAEKAVEEARASPEPKAAVAVRRRPRKGPGPFLGPDPLLSTEFLLWVRVHPTASWEPAGILISDPWEFDPCSRQGRPRWEYTLLQRSAVARLQREAVWVAVCPPSSPGMDGNLSGRSHAHNFN